jgi:hypothetical protein
MDNFGKWKRHMEKNPTSLANDIVPKYKSNHKLFFSIHKLDMDFKSLNT